MIVWVRNFVVIFVFLGILYVILDARARWRKRAELNKQYDAEKPAGSRVDFVAEGMKAYKRSLRPKLLFGIFTLPLLLMIGMLALALH